MYKILPLFYLVFCATTFCSRSRNDNEFETFNNDLIYSKTTMNTLQHLVDSLNLKFKRCPLNKIFYAKQQTLGHYIQLDTADVQQAKIDLKNQMPFEKFIQKYPLAKVEKNVLLIKYKYTNNQNIEKVAFSKIALGNESSIEISLDIKKSPYEKNCKNTWVIQHYEKTEYSNEEIQAFFFPEEFESKPIPSKYALQIAYADCLIDTTATKFKSELKEGWVDLPQNWLSLPHQNKLKLLDEMRATQVVGSCSMDSSPRKHALNIALLSAETTQWNIFLKAHLDIMNDRFLRITDGSYAYGKRKTYIKELESLNINVPDLLFGTTIQLGNPAKNHYVASINRIGRAIAEAKDKDAFEIQLLNMIANQDLDNYNRILAYFMMDNANYYIQDKQEQKEKKLVLAKAVNTLPLALKNKIK